MQDRCACKRAQAVAAVLVAGVKVGAVTVTRELDRSWTFLNEVRFALKILSPKSQMQCQHIGFTVLKKAVENIAMYRDL